MRNQYKYLFVGVLLTVALVFAWADDYVDDVYFWDETPTTTCESPAGDPRETPERPTTDTLFSHSDNIVYKPVKKMEFMPQVSDTVVKLKIVR